MWAPSFLADLRASPVRPGFAVETFRTARGMGPGLGGEIYATRPLPGARPWLMLEGLAFGSQGVRLQAWTYQASSWRFSLSVPSGEMGTVAAALRRGTLLHLRVGMPSAPYGAWEIVQSGQVSRISSPAPNRVDVDVWDIVSALRSRITNDEAELVPFPTQASKTVIADYVAGAPSIDASGTADYSRQTAGLGLLLVTPTAGSAFYLTYTGHTIIGGTDSRFSGLSTTNKFDTTIVDALTGSTVAPVPYLVGRPDQIVARVLTSTGLGTNGTYDILPETWGYALPWSEAVDTSDIVLEVGNTILGRVGTYEWQVRAGTAAQAGLSWLQGQLAAMGAWICQRQGRLTLRVAQDGHLSSGWYLHTGLTITDADIISASVDWYDTSITEYAQLQVISENNTTGWLSPSVSTLPASELISMDLSDRLWGTSGEQSAIRNEVGDRVNFWSLRIAEVVSLVVYIDLAQLAPGDLVALTTRRIAGRLVSTVGGYVDRTGMVLSMSPGWLAGTVALRIAFSPESTADDWAT